MITTITRFPLPSQVTREQILQGFRDAAPHFQNVKGLVRKQFLLSDSGKIAGGVYLWESREDAQTFLEGVVRSMIRNAFGVEADIQYFETPVIVEGQACALT